MISGLVAFQNRALRAMLAEMEIRLTEKFQQQFVSKEFCAAYHDQNLAKIESETERIDRLERHVFNGTLKYIRKRTGETD